MIKSRVGPCFLCLMIGAFAISIPAQESAFARYITEVKKAGICFKQYPAVSPWQGLRHRPTLDTALKRRFKTRLIEASRQAPNFAGKYVVAEWGCGSNCQHFMIIDLEAGTVTDGFTTSWGIKYQVDSTLLVVHPHEVLCQKGEPTPTMLPMDFFTSYYEWRHNTLVRIRTIPSDP